MIDSVEGYFQFGCMRCEYGGTPQCKVHNWTKELELLREIILETNLKEVVKWGVPCYMHGSNNVLLLSALKDECTVSFFKGALLSDTYGLLDKPGKHSQAARLFRFTSVEQIVELKDRIIEYILEAVEVEKAGLRIEFKSTPEPMPQELINRMECDDYFKNAFEALTPGRQRGYIIYFSAPKKTETRESRIDKFTPKILNGEGMHDHYQRKKRK